MEVGMVGMYEIKELVRNDEQGKPVYRTVEVPDGKWVVKLHTSGVGEQVYDECSDEGDVVSEGFVEEQRWIYEIVGPKPTGEYIVARWAHRSGDEIRVRWSHSTTRVLVGDAPFGVIHINEENRERSPFRHFVAARQVHKGELGRGPQFHRPQFAREARDPKEHAWESEDLSEGAKPLVPRDLRRHHACWARLVDVATLMDLLEEQLVCDFFPFADAKGRGLPVLFAASREEIHGKIIPPNAVERFTERELPRLFDRNPNTIWVRAGFAKTVLCLHHLGYKPDAVSKIS